MTGPLLIIGREGQLARALREATGDDARALGRADFDLHALDAIEAKVAALAPSAIINAAAYTAVDKAESDSEAAFRLNRDAPAALARAAAALDIPLVHVSTDCVFDGEKSTPYLEDDPKAPLGIYGLSKSEGEDAVLASGARAAVLRTSWVFSATGSNFVHIMLRLSETRDAVQVVADQVGQPTFAPDLAQACLAAAQALSHGEKSAAGVFHVAGAGALSRADFAEAIFAEAGKQTRVERITTAEYPTPARRPKNSRLDTTKFERVFGVRPRPWRETLRACLQEMG